MEMEINISNIENTKVTKVTNNIKQVQVFELIGESLCAIGSILYIIDASTNGEIIIYSIKIEFLYLLGSILFLLGSILMIIQSVLTIKNINN